MCDIYLVRLSLCFFTEFNQKLLELGHFPPPSSTHHGGGGGFLSQKGGGCIGFSYLARNLYHFAALGAGFEVLIARWQHSRNTWQSHQSWQTTILGMATYGSHVGIEGFEGGSLLRLTLCI
jgi:hypothetical protein